MEIIKKINELEIHLEEKVVKLAGHQDGKVFTLFTESLATSPSLSSEEKSEIYNELRKRDDIVVR